MREDHNDIFGRLASIEAPEDVKKRLKRESDAAKKKVEQAEALVDDARAMRVVDALEMELFCVESAGLELLDESPDWTADKLANEIERKNAEARAHYVGRFTIDDKGKAGWAAGKIAEARTNEERTKEIWRAECRRAERLLENRKAFFEFKILEWAKTAGYDKGTGKPELGTGSIRCPEHKVRIQVQQSETGGVTILDENALCEEIIEKLGPLAAMDLGLVKQGFRLVKAATEDFIAGMQAVPGGTPVAGTGNKIDFKFATWEPVKKDKKLVIVRL